MVGGAMGTAFSLLLLSSIIQGHQDVEVFHYEKMEAVEGQNVTIPCVVKSSSDLKIVSIEWRRNREKNIKLAVYSSSFGVNLVWPNVTIQIESTSMGSYLHLYGVSKWDSDIYICDIASFPVGSIQTETELQIKDDVRIMCDAESTIEVHSGENVTIQCRAFPDVEYKWTKNKMLVSENESLELCRVTDAHTGVYTLTVNTGNKSLHKDFIITVQTATTTDLVTVPPQSNATEEDFINSTDSGLTTSPTTGLLTTDTSVTWAMSMSTDVTEDNLTPSNVTAEERTTSSTNSTRSSVTPSPVTHTDPYRFNSSTDQEINTAHYFSTYSEQPTQEMRNESMGVNPDATTAPSTGSATAEDDDILLVLIIVPVLVLIAVAGFLYRRQIIKRRMDLPPPFKPPPPPVKYTAARHREISPQPFPISRCNSLTDMRQMFINKQYNA